MKQLHILNGDASLPAFEAAGFAGEVLVWREILADGPAVYTLPEEAFWQQREQYITSTYRETSAGYKQKVLAELEKLEKAPRDREVILWFDADLICQVNLLYLLSKLKTLKFHSVSVCSPEAHESIGLLQPERLQEVYRQRQPVSPQQLQQAQELWQLYAGPNPFLLQTYLSANTLLFPYLTEALHLHLKRFPDCVSGLGYPEGVLLELIQKGATTATELMQAFWQQEPGYGFGDWQLETILRRLQPALVSTNEPLTLTEQGQKVLKQTIARLAGEEEHWVGGVLLHASDHYCYNKQVSRLEHKP